MTTLDDPGSYAPPARSRQPAFWMAFVAILLLICGLFAIAVPDSMSGPVVREFGANHGLRQADVIGLILLVLGSGLVWITGLIWQWRYTR